MFDYLTELGFKLRGLNPFRVRIVRFSNGKYGITRGAWAFRQFFDFHSADRGSVIWWSFNSQWLSHCMAEEELAFSWFHKLRATWKYTN